MMKKARGERGKVGNWMGGVGGVIGWLGDWLRDWETGGLGDEEKGKLTIVAISLNYPVVMVNGQ